jgi:hypothetical protein
MRVCCEQPQCACWSTRGKSLGKTLAPDERNNERVTVEVARKMAPFWKTRERDTLSYLPVGRRVRVERLKRAAGRQNLYPSEERKHARHELFARQLYPACFSVRDDDDRAGLNCAVYEGNHAVLQNLELLNRLWSALQRESPKMAGCSLQNGRLHSLQHSRDYSRFVEAKPILNAEEGKGKVLQRAHSSQDPRTTYMREPATRQQSIVPVKNYGRVYTA